MKVSVIIPCFNVAEYIEDCLESVYTQIYSDLEVIAVDNNSTDETRNILERYQQEHQPGLILLHEATPGASAARNAGLQRASGDWIQFLDADDLLLPEKIQHQIDLLNQTTSPIMFIAGASKKRFVDGNEKIYPVSTLPPLVALFQGNGQLGNTCANLWQRAAILEVGGWNKEYLSSQEAELMYRLLKEDSLVLKDNELLTIIRERTQGQISDRSEASRIRFMELRLQMLGYLKEEQPSLFKQYYDTFHSKLFDVCLMIAEHNIPKAEHFYQQLPGDFRVVGSIAKRFYKSILDLFGFERIERLRIQLRRR